MAYPEGMTVEVTFSPTLKRFAACALMRDGEEIFSFQSSKLSEALEELAAEIRSRYEG